MIQRSPIKIGGITMSEYKGEKYIVIEFYQDRYYFLESMDEVQEWLDSGSFEEGDMVFELSKPKILTYETTRKFKDFMLASKVSEEMS